jgi:RimJ/RimL family protein N-acetyltransferase
MPPYKEWAADPFLHPRVGSELLSPCRHRDVEDPEFASAILHDPRAVTFVVEALEGPAMPLGFVRLYGVDLPEQYGFVETVLTEGRLLRKGWGIQATRLFVAWAQDTLRVRRVEAKVYSYNVLSINSLKRNGFEQEGVLRGARFYGGQRWDILVFGLVEEEMNAQREQSPFPYLGFWP